jgi:hypothetical protein
MGTSFLRAYVLWRVPVFFSEVLIGMGDNRAAHIFLAAFSRGPNFDGTIFWVHIFPAGEFSPRGSIWNTEVNCMINKSKLSKKARKELDKQKRVTWDFSPVSRVKQSKKIYNRKRLRDPE